MEAGALAPRRGCGPSRRHGLGRQKAQTARHSPSTSSNEAGAMSQAERRPFFSVLLEAAVGAPPMSATVAGFLMPRQTEACVTEEDRWWQAWRSEGRVEIALVASYAGSAAEARHCKKSIVEVLKRRGSPGSAHAHSLSDMYFETSERAAIARDLGLSYAKSLVRSPKGWAAMTSIAAALRGRRCLDALQVDELCHAAYGARPNLFGWDPYWPPGYEEIAAGDLPTDDVPWPIPEDPQRRAYVFASVSFGPWALNFAATP